MTNFYNKYNLSIKSDFFDVQVFWLDGVYPSNVLKLLIQSGFIYNKEENCWQAKSTPVVEKTANDIIAIAEKLRGGKECRTESAFQSIEKQDELNFFITLNTQEDYKQFLENLNNDENYIYNLNKEKWDKINSNISIITDIED